MPVVVPLVAVGVAILLLLVAYALTVLVTPLIESVLREVPLVGGYLADKVKNGVEWFAGTLIGWVNTTVHKLVEWFHALTRAWSEFVDAVNAFIVDVPDRLDHLAHVTVHDIVKAFLRPVEQHVDALQATVDGLPADLADVFTKPLSDFKGIEHGVELRVDHLAHVLRNVDLPALLDQADADAHRFVDVVGSEVDDLTGYVDQEFARLWDQLGKLPLQQLLEGLAASAALGLLVHTITAEAGLDNAECRAKFKQVCSTNPAAWADLLVLAGAAFTWPGLRAMVDVARDLTRELAPAVREVVSGG